MGVMLQQRSFGDDIKNFSTTFTSFDKCMEKRTCKIPFIVLCVVGGLIVISTLWCLLRCIMCGYTCCACCCGGCGGRRHKTEHTTTYVLPSAHHGPVIDRPPATHYDEPKYAYFDSNPDALPHMPSVHGVEVKMPVAVVEEHEMTPVKGGLVAPDLAGSVAGHNRPYEVGPERSGSAQGHNAGSRSRSPAESSVYSSSIRSAQLPPPVYQQPQRGDMQHGNSRALVPPRQQYPQQHYQQQRGYNEDIPTEPYQHGRQQQHGHQQQQRQRGYEDDMPAEPYQYGQHQQQNHHQPGPPRAYDDRRRQEEWSVI